jgi:hypothetical protein
MKGTTILGLRRPIQILWIALAAILPVGAALAAGPFNEREAKPQRNVEDTEGIWVLDFRFKDPRMITVDIPGRGRKVCWYLWYQVINNPPPDGHGSKDPVTFIPDFELVTLDKPGVYHDQVLPKVQDAIQKIEDPAGYEEKKRGREPYLDIKNSVSIAGQPIPPSKPDAFPRAVTGVAIWDDVPPDTSRFSIFVSGLSNGWAKGNLPDNQPVILRKTLRLNFRRLGDRSYQDSSEIRFVHPAEWLYRASKLNLSAPAKQPPAPAKPAAFNLPVEDPLQVITRTTPR